MTALKARCSALKRALALCGGALAGLVLVELAVRVFVPVREVGPTFTEWHPTDGIQMRRSIRVQRSTPEFSMELRTNADGFRGPELPAEFERSVLFLGDSFTLGYGVDDGLEFPHRIRSVLPPGWTAINAGIGGTGNGRWPRFLEREGERLRPEVVVLQLCGNDLDDNLHEGLYSLDARGDLVAHAPPPPSRTRRIQALIDRVPGLSYLHVVGVARKWARDRSDQASAASPGSLASAQPVAPEPAASGAPGLELTLALVRRSVELCRGLEARCVLLSAEPGPALRPALAELTAELGLTWIEVPAKAERPDLYFHGDGHWNAAGHAFAAELLWAELGSPAHMSAGGRSAPPR